MPLSIGDKLGHYEIAAPLGAGGMGEVYKARDTQLEREVAIKVLPQALARDPERLARFDREAKILAGLNHPNIAVIYGLAETKGQRALVMELVPGDTLGARIKRGAMPAMEALQIARQIAEALEAAHEKGITHRDLKPGNVMITPTGLVKVLDFGLAAINQPAASADPNNSPTLTMGMTQAGTIMGTASYMSPEQAEGLQVDKRADIWSFGVVLWEMLTGKRLFEGQTVSRTLADVLRMEIDFTKLPNETSPSIRALLQRCLDREVNHRLRDIGEARVAIQKHIANPESGHEPAPSGSRFSTVAPWAVTAVALAVAAWALWPQPAPRLQALNFTIDPPPGMQFGNVNGAGGVPSPDGSLLVFAAAPLGAQGRARGLDPGTQGLASLWLRPMNSLDARLLPGTAGANFPFWSPDGKSIGFVAANELKRVEALGGSPQTLCPAPVFEGGTWNAAGVILFSSRGVIHSVRASGGQPTPLTKADVTLPQRQLSPHFLPDGRAFLYRVEGADGSADGIYAASLDRTADPPVKLVSGSNRKAEYAPPVNGGQGHLLWVRDQTLVAQRFDPRSLKLEGDPVPVAEQIAVGTGQTRNTRTSFWISASGLLVYRTGADRPQSVQMTWIGRDGKQREPVGAPRDISTLRLSPDGRRVAFEQTLSGNTDIFLHEFERGSELRLTSDPGIDHNPVWSPDGSQLAYTSTLSGPTQLYRISAAGGGQEERLHTSSVAEAPVDWSPDGKFLAFGSRDGTNTDQWLMPFEGERKPVPFLRTQFNESDSQFSPDGKWIVYQSNESGATEVYIRAFPGGPAGQWSVSVGGGNFPRWRGNEVFYRSQGKMMAASLRLLANRVEVEKPRELFQLPPGPTPYDVTTDGRRFLMLVQPEAADRDEVVGVSTIKVISNWQALLK